jgi:hypothetical protein
MDLNDDVEWYEYVWIDLLTKLFVQISVQIWNWEEKKKEAKLSYFCCGAAEFFEKK